MWTWVGGKGPTTKGSWCLIGLKFTKGKESPIQTFPPETQQNTESSSNFCTGPVIQPALLKEACAELPALTVFLPPETGVSGILFQPTGLRFPPSNWRELRSSHQSEQLNSNGVFWTIQTVRIWSPRVHEGRPVRDQQQGLLSIQASSPLAWGAPFPFPLKTKDCLPGWVATLKISRWSRPDQTSAA